MDNQYKTQQEFTFENPPEVYPGQMISYVLPDGPFAGEKRPAMVIKIWSAGTVNALVFLDGLNDVGPNEKITDATSVVRWATSIQFHEDKTATGHWHLPGA